MSPSRPLAIALLLAASLALTAQTQPNTPPQSTSSSQSSTLATSQTTATGEHKVSGFVDFTREAAIQQQFLSVPKAQLAAEHLKKLTAAPHISGSPEDKATAEYVAAKFREAGLDTEIVEYKVWFNYPRHILVEATGPNGLLMRGPSKEHVEGDPFQDDPRVTTAFNGGSPSGEVTADAVYANYGRPEDFKKLKQMGVDMKGKIALVRYGQNFRGVKSYVATEYGLAGVIIYSDPYDDGYFKGDMYPKGPWRPKSAVQRGSLLYMFKFPGDPETPGVASTVDLPASQRIDPKLSDSQPKVLTTPLSYGDASPILENLGGPLSPRDWQGALPFAYHVGPGPVKVHLKLDQDYALRSIWDVIGKIKGIERPNEWVVAGNHRDAWVYGAVDPSSGTSSMLEAVHGLGELIKSGWRPKRTIVIGSWDAEEQGLIGSTEWGEQHEKDLATAAAYFNMDVAVAGPHFGASAVPSLKQFVREVAKEVPSANGKGSVYDEWREHTTETARHPDDGTARNRAPNANVDNDLPVGDLGSGSDYTVFLQRMGVPSDDIGSGGDYGVYHSVFDNYAYFSKFSDPTFAYLEQMAKVFGVEILHMADCDVLPYDYKTYGGEIVKYLQTAQKKAEQAKLTGLDFAPAIAAAQRFQTAGEKAEPLQAQPGNNGAALDATLIATERAMLLPEGLPNRKWFRHPIYAPGVYTGYAAVVIPGVNEALDANDSATAANQLQVLTQALTRAATKLESLSSAAGGATGR